MSSVSTDKKSSSVGNPSITIPPVTGESGGVTADSVEEMAEQTMGSLFGALPEPSGLVKAAVVAAQAAATAAGMTTLNVMQ